MRAARERQGQSCRTTRGEVNPGEVWEENEFWFELTWRIDPDGSLGIRTIRRIDAQQPGTKLTVDEYYGYIFEHSVPGLPAPRQRKRLTPLEFMRRYGAFEIQHRRSGALHEELVPMRNWTTCARTGSAVCTRARRSPRR